MVFPYALLSTSKFRVDGFWLDLRLRIQDFDCWMLWPRIYNFDLAQGG